MNSFVRWKKVLHPVLGNITDNTDMALKIEGRVHRKDKSVTENEHTVKKKKRLHPESFAFIYIEVDELIL